MNTPKWWGSPKPWRIGDCLDIMKSMPDECVDLLLTDPPFNVGINYGDTTNDTMTDAEYTAWFTPRVKEMERILKPNRVIIIFSGDTTIHPIWDALNTTALKFHHFLKWSKPNSQSTLNGFRLFNRTELAFLATKGKPDQNVLTRKIVYSDTLEENATSVKGGDDFHPVDHPCRRPSKLYARIIAGFSLPGEVVFDPFLGSGTAILGAKLVGRVGLGSEINPEFEKLIKERYGEENGGMLYTEHMQSDITGFSDKSFS
jgi:DNA modification methylase